MNIQVGWDNAAKTVIRYTFGSQWAPDDLIAAARADDELMASVDHTVHLIFDLTNAPTSPGNFLSAMREMSGEVHDQLGLIVLVNANAFMQSMVGIFYNVFGARKRGLAGIKFARTLDDARQLIDEFEVQTRA